MGHDHPDPIRIVWTGSVFEVLEASRKQPLGRVSAGSKNGSLGDKSAGPKSGSLEDKWGDAPS